jgi:hypothetical protein
MAKQERGLRGERGIPGPPGPAGSDGVQGITGKAGHAGARGPSGARGAKGLTGDHARPVTDALARKRLVATVDRHIENIYGELTAQIKRLAKLQSQIDELRAKIRRIA